MAGYKQSSKQSDSSGFEDETDRTYLDDDKSDCSPDPTKKPAKEEKKNGQAAAADEESKEPVRAPAPQKSAEEIAKEKERGSFRKRKFNRFMDPPRWVMAERCFETQRRLRCKKLWWEDYSSSSDNDDIWGREVENILSEDGK